MSYIFSTGEELVEICAREKITIAEAMIRSETETSEMSRKDIINEMYENLLTMQECIRQGLEERDLISRYGKRNGRMHVMMLCTASTGRLKLYWKKSKV